MTARPPTGPSKGWEALARQQSRWLFDLLRLLLLALLAFLGPRLV